jgi:hypothetical protein
MDTKKSTAQGTGSNSQAGLPLNQTDASANRPKLTKRLLMSLPAGSFVSMGVLGSLYRNRVTGERHLGPSWEGLIEESPEARLAQWEEIKACGANGRTVFDIEAPGEISMASQRRLSHERLPASALRDFFAEFAKRQSPNDGQPT